GAERGPYRGAAGPLFLPRAQRLDRPGPRPTVPAVGGLPQAVPHLVGAEPVPLQVGLAPPTRLPVEHRWPGGPGQPQPPGRHGPGEPAGEPDLGVLPQADRRSPRRRLAAADGPAVDPHEGPGRGPAAGTVRRLDRWIGIFSISHATLRPLPDAAAWGEDFVHAPGAGDMASGAARDVLLDRQ